MITMVITVNCMKTGRLIVSMLSLLIEITQSRIPPCFLTKCPIRKYCNELVTGETECRNCQKGCLRCDSPDACLECEPGYKLDNHLCSYLCKEQACDEGQHCVLGKDRRPYCKRCHESCDTCYGPGPSQCFECGIGYERRHSNCVRQEILQIDGSGCKDDPHALVNKMSCPEAVKGDPGLCAQRPVQVLCCASCATVAGPYREAAEEAHPENFEGVLEVFFTPVLLGSMLMTVYAVLKNFRLELGGFEEEEEEGQEQEHIE